MGGLKESRWAKAAWLSNNNNNRWSHHRNSSTYSPSVPPSKTTTTALSSSSSAAVAGRSSSISHTGGNDISTTPSTSLPARVPSPQINSNATAAAPPPSASCLIPQSLPQAARQPAQELTRYSKIVRRLNWKLPYLADGYHAATSHSATPDRRAEAELMFKLDFYEYYMLLERALVHLLGVFDIHISSHRGIADNGITQNTHRYHANVLAALDLDENPLHQVLGQGETRRLLGRAKDLRNRWKYAEEDEEDRAGAQLKGLGASRHALGPRRRFGAQALSTYDVENMLLHIFIAFDAAFKVAEEHVLRIAAAAATRPDETSLGALVDMDWRAENEEEEHWDFMVEAMDWEAV